MTPRAYPTSTTPPPAAEAGAGTTASMSLPRRALRAATPRRGLVVGLALSIAIHTAVSFVPDEDATSPETVPLQATITEMPPPPVPAVTAAKARPKPQRPTAVRPPPESTAAAVEEVPAREPELAPIEPTAEALAAGPEQPVEVAAAPSPDALAEPPKTLPRRVDLVYKAFLGEQGMLIGQAVYRFEHDGQNYHIMTIGEAKGLAAIFVRGQGKLESRGLITPTGLRPYEFVVERGSSERRETAVFDWETGMVTLYEQKTEALEPSTYDPLTLMWQAYFTPPVDNVQDISIATTRRVGRHTLTREADETIAWSQGEIATERWRRRSEDGNTETTVWLAPSLRYVPVKMRLMTNYKSLFGATLEATLDSIRVDETLARQ